MRKIALSGMKGRKKDTFLLSFIIFLSFLFVTITIILYSSNEKTKMDERAKSYGLWENSFLNMDKDFFQELKKKKNINSIGKSRIIGRSNEFGLIGSFDEEYLKLANFEIIEGHFPKNDNEIMIELNQLKYFHQNPGIGDKINIRIVIPIIDTDVSSISGNKFKTYESEVLSGIRVWVDTIYIIDEEGKSSRIGQKVILEKEMTISGIINNYTDAWHLKQSLLPNSYITEEASIKFMEECFYKSHLFNPTEHELPVNYLVSSNLTPYEFLELYNEKYPEIYVNDLTYPKEESNKEKLLTYGILASIYIITIFSVLQIYLIQLKRRLRKMALFKAIGATNKQISKLLIWETTYILIFSMPLGIIFGFVITKLITVIMGTSSLNNISIFIDYKLIISGILICLLSVIVAIIIPLLLCQKVKPIGEISITSEKLKQSAREKLGSRKSKSTIMNLKNINKRNEKYNRRSNIITFGLYTLTMFVILLAIYLSFMAFEIYIDEVVISRKPSFQLTANYGYKTTEMANLINEINNIENVKSADGFKYIDKCEFRYEGMKNDPIYNKILLLMEDKYLKEHLKIDRETGIIPYFYVGIYGINTDSEIFRQIEDILGYEINKGNFESGNEVIVFYPMYKELKKDSELVIIEDKFFYGDTTRHNRIKKIFDYSEAMNITYNAGYRPDFTRYDGLKKGMKIELRRYYNYFSSDGKIKINPTIAGYINYFPSTGIWPFSKTIETPVIIGSYSMLEKLYPESRLGLGQLDVSQYETLRRASGSDAYNKYGKTMINIYTEDIDKYGKTYLELLRLGEKRGLDVVNFEQENLALFNKSLQTTIIIILLAILIAAISLQIQYNSLKSKLEQERKRIGILQSIGVENKDLQKLYLVKGIKYSVASILASHILLFIAFIITGATTIKKSAFSIYYLIDYIADSLYMYPFKLHIFIILVLSLFIALTYYVPVRKIVNRPPISNIRELSR